MLAKHALRRSSTGFIPLTCQCQVLLRVTPRRPLSLATSTIKVVFTPRSPTTTQRCSTLPNKGQFPQGWSTRTQFVRWKGCWNCSAEVSDENGATAELVECKSCGVPQKGTGDYFSLLGMKKGTYRVDLGALSMRVKGLQRKLHPDLFAQREKEAQEASEELSSLVNKAFATLASPIARGRYLLRLKGVDDPEGDAEKSLTNDPQFLQEVMELNEQLEELQNEEEWRDFRQRNQVAFNELERELEKAFDKDDTKAAQILLGRLKYYDTLDKKLKDLKFKLGIVE